MALEPVVVTRGLKKSFKPTFIISNGKGRVLELLKYAV